EDFDHARCDGTSALSATGAGPARAGAGGHRGTDFEGVSTIDNQRRAVADEHDSAARVYDRRYADEPGALHIACAWPGSDLRRSRPHDVAVGAGAPSARSACACGIA